jgi:putative copper export protein
MRHRRTTAGPLRETTEVDDALRIVHLLAATVWVGGTIALVFVAVPPVQRLEGELRARTLRAFGERWRPIGWSALGVAIVTGGVIAARAHAFDTTPDRFDWVLGIKGALVGLLVAGAYLHDYVLGPGLARQIRSGEPQTLRPLLTVIGRGNLLITIALPILGALLTAFLED